MTKTITIEQMDNGWVVRIHYGFKGGRGTYIAKTKDEVIKIVKEELTK